MREEHTNSRELRQARHDAGMLSTDRLEQSIDISTASGLDPVGSKETDLMTQDGAQVRERFPSYLRPVSTLIVDEARNSNPVAINRTEPFDPVKFMNHPGLEVKEQDERSIMLEEIDPSSISLQSMLASETVIRGEEHLKRLKQMGYIRLDARIFQTLWENQHLIPESWKGTPDNPKHIFFDGTVLKNQCGRYVITMYWDKDEKWRWTYCRLDIGGWRIEDVSAVLKVQ